VARGDIAVCETQDCSLRLQRDSWLLAAFYPGYRAYDAGGRIVIAGARSSQVSSAGSSRESVG
jgi:hypothetical protein